MLMGVDAATSTRTSEEPGSVISLTRSVCEKKG